MEKSGMKGKYGNSVRRAKRAENNSAGADEGGGRKLEKMPG
jgi:hypothetical protein